MTTTPTIEEKDKDKPQETLPSPVVPPGSTMDWATALSIALVIVVLLIVSFFYADALATLRDIKFTCDKAATQPVLTSTGGALSTAATTTSTQHFGYQDRKDDASYHLHLWSTSDGAQRGELTKRNGDGTVRWTAALRGIDAKGMHFEGLPNPAYLPCARGRIAVVARYVCGGSREAKLHVDWDKATCSGTLHIETPDACPPNVPEHPATTLRRLMNGQRLGPLTRGGHSYTLTLPSPSEPGYLQQDDRYSCGSFVPPIDGSARRLESAEYGDERRSTQVTLFCRDKYELLDVHEIEPRRYVVYVGSPHGCGSEVGK
jgi:hypothetical protein